MKESRIPFFVAILIIWNFPGTALSMEWQRKGKSFIRVYQDAVEDNEYEDNQAIDSRIRLENNILFKDWDLCLGINLEGRYEALIGEKTDKEGDLLLKESYIQLRKENYSFSLGRQVVTWGKLDNIIILDTITPQDYSRFILFDKQERKLPEFMLKYDFFADDFQIESVFMPIFKPSYLRFFGSDWAIFGHLKDTIEGGTYTESTKRIVRDIKIEEKEELTENSLKNSQLGIRLRSKIGEFDYGLYYMNIYNRIPVLKEKTSRGNTVKKFIYLPTDENLTELVNLNPTSDDLTLISQHRRINVIGIDVETVFGRYGVRGELGLFLGSPYLSRDFSYTKKNTLSLGYGLDHTTANNFYYNLQLIENIILNYEDLFAQEESDHRLIYKASKDFLRGNLQFNFDSSYSLSYHDWMLNPELTYKFKNGFDTSFGGFIFEGSLTSVFGKYSTKDLIYLEMVYKF